MDLIEIKNYKSKTLFRKTKIDAVFKCFSNVSSIPCYAFSCFERFTVDKLGLWLEKELFVYNAPKVNKQIFQIRLI